MRKILVLGAGHSAPFLIHYLLEHAHELDAHVVVADRDVEAAARRVDGHERGEAMALDLDGEHAGDAFAGAALVVHLLPPPLQGRVARLCVEHGCHLVSASYRSPAVEELAEGAAARGIGILCEFGLDPGIDLMSAQHLIDQAHGRGQVVDRFLSYGGGLPEPSFDGNPLRYCITWNPRNVVMAGDRGAQYLRRGDVKLLPWHRVFDATWSVDIPELGTLDAYANRDSISYRSIHGVESIRTLVRGTLRYPGFCQLWHLIVRLGLPNEHLQVPRLGERTWAELTEMFLPLRGASCDLPTRIAHYLGLPPDDSRLAQLGHLGLYSDEVIGIDAETPAQALIELLQRRLPLPEGGRDMVVLHHEIETHAQDGSGDNDSGGDGERILSTMIHYGDDRFTAMAQTVGLPAALGCRLLLDGTFSRSGLLGPTDHDIYRPILKALDDEGLRFEEQRSPLAR